MEYFTKLILLTDGWKQNARLNISPLGDITEIKVNTYQANARFIDGIVIPGLPNLHSHAFQRAMAGLAEFSDSGQDDFWSWRDTMYKLANRISPEQLQSITAQLYMEMLKAGYTSVAEFHYLHHDISGARYATPSEMSDRIIAAAAHTGIGLTLLPVLYMTANIGEEQSQDQQHRFINTVEDYLTLLDDLLNRQSEQLKPGVAFHSLRAVPQYAISETLNYLGSSTLDCPIHIHIAEQSKEVQTCMEVHGCRPVQWLLDQYPVNDHWTLIHATHATSNEIEAMAASGCVVGLCPSTEANLGDGIFSLKPYLEAGGRFGIGSDSHISVSPVEELRWLEYGQRLTTQRRNITTSKLGRNTGNLLWQLALSGGARAQARNIDGIKEGNRADLVVLKSSHPLLVSKTPEFLLDSFIFSGNDSLVQDVMVGGQWLVTDSIHRNEDEINQVYKQTLAELATAASS